MAGLFLGNIFKQGGEGCNLPCRKSTSQILNIAIFKFAIF